MPKVIKAFFDKEDNRKPYSEGDFFEGEDKRVKELTEKGFLDDAKPKKKEAAKKDEKKKDDK